MTSITVTIKPRGPDKFNIGQQGFTVSTWDDVKIKSLKTDIQDLRNIPPSEQLLWLENNKLTDNNVQLKNAGVVDRSIIHLQHNNYFRIYFYRSTDSEGKSEEIYVDGTENLTTLMDTLEMPKEYYSVDMNGVLFKDAEYYSTLNALNIFEGRKLKFCKYSKHG